MFWLIRWLLRMVHVVMFWGLFRMEQLMLGWYVWRIWRCNRCWVGRWNHDWVLWIWLHCCHRFFVLSGLSGLSGLSRLSKLSRLSGLSGLSKLSGLSGLSGLSRLYGLSGLSRGLSGPGDCPNCPDCPRDCPNCRDCLDCPDCLGDCPDCPGDCPGDCLERPPPTLDAHDWPWGHNNAAAIVALSACHLPSPAASPEARLSRRNTMGSSVLGSPSGSLIWVPRKWAPRIFALIWTS